ncbi:ETX/MTX2 family pore-forming toxin [Bacillus cereus]|uniref:Uncharacterized protein n=1 Tax=Bacillus cereus TaxID=1396 RepID=A0A2A8ZSL2_BACCE|nr:ETX/MTX2 family pore-forming toxin [Bacillus cereus]PFE06727.1 hypothetical protein CN307_32445 [Bacillus cereus]
MKKKNKMRLATGVTSAAILASAFGGILPSASAETPNRVESVQQGAKVAAGDFLTDDQARSILKDPLGNVEKYVNIHKQVRNRVTALAGKDMNILALDRYMADLWYLDMMVNMHRINNRDSQAAAQIITSGFDEKEYDPSRYTPSFNWSSGNVGNFKEILNVTHPLSKYKDTTTLFNNSSLEQTANIVERTIQNTQRFSTTTSQGWSVGGSASGGPGQDFAKSGPFKLLDIGITGSFNMEKSQTEEQGSSQALIIPRESYKAPARKGFYASRSTVTKHYKYEADVNGEFNGEVGINALLIERKPMRNLISYYQKQLPKGITLTANSIKITGKGTIEAGDFANAVDTVIDIQEFDLPGDGDMLGHTGVKEWNIVEGHQGNEIGNLYVNDITLNLPSGKQYDYRVKVNGRDLGVGSGQVSSGTVKVDIKGWNAGNGFPEKSSTIELYAIDKATGKEALVAKRTPTLTESVKKVEAKLKNSFLENININNIIK